MPRRAKTQTLCATDAPCRAMMHDPEVLFRGAIRGTVVVRQVEMGHAAIEGATDHRASSLEDVTTAKVLPKPEGNRRENQS